MSSHHVSNASSDIVWQPEARLALVSYTAGATLHEEDGTLLVEALRGWVGTEGRPFGVLANAKGLKATDGDYRARVGDYFKQHREAYIALTDMGPVIRVVVELFRVGTGVSLKAFATEAGAREWFRSVGIAA
ncbi:MAG: hypothetical protein IPJ65_30765 [Archangiaceae bacterium]|nr:hypothetical protein [Archangiaceae bacterium]